MNANDIWSFLILTNLLSMSSGFLLGPPVTTLLEHSLNSIENNNLDNGCTPRVLDRQSDSKYGRGISHISADLSEGDIIAYQYGTWYVDRSWRWLSSNCAIYES